MSAVPAGDKRVALAFGRAKVAAARASLSDEAGRDFPRVLVIGGSGFLGQSIILAGRSAGLGERVAGTYGQHCLPDLLPLPLLVGGALDRDTITECLRHTRPGIVVNAAGIADPGQCAVRPALTHTLNTLLPCVLAEIIANRCPACTLVQLSSEVVALGEAVDAKDECFVRSAPPTEETYALAKWRAEQALEDVPGGRTLCLRIPMVTGPLHTGTGWGAQVFRMLSSGQRVYAPLMGPRGVASVSEIGYAILLICGAVAAGRLPDGYMNLVGPRPSTRYDQACVIARILGLPVDLVAPLDTGVRRVTRTHDVSDRLGIALAMTPDESFVLGATIGTTGCE